MEASKWSESFENYAEFPCFKPKRRLSFAYQSLVISSLVILFAYKIYS